jgi:hypothetical protein
MDIIKMDLVEIGWGAVDWSGLSEDREKWRTEEWCLLGCYAVWLL